MKGKATSRQSSTDDHGHQVAKPLCILIVDDSELILVVLRELLATVGHHATTAVSGAEAIEVLGRGGIDLIISDYHMPGMDGLELLKALREMGNEIPFFLMTGTAPEECREKALQIGADGFITKPVNIHEVLETIARVVAAARTP